MKAFFGALAFSLATTAFAHAGAPLQNALLDHLCGRWVMHGEMGGKAVTHDIKAAWTLQHQYVLLEETSRDKGKDGQPAYATHLYFAWDAPSKRYACVLLDTFGELSTESLGRAEKSSGSSITFVFDEREGGHFYSTFTYNAKTDSWQISMDDQRDGKRTPFARTEWTRA